MQLTNSFLGFNWFPYSHTRRALPNAPDGYAPKGVSCPSDRPSIRTAGELSTNETSWLEKRRSNTMNAMRELLTRLNISNFDASGYIDSASRPSDLPTIAIAASGGGYRALLNGAGAVAAFDARTDNSTSPAQLGGLLQSTTYFSGLSGGSWLVGSIFVNNFTTISSLLSESSGSVWEFGNSILKGPESDAGYYVQLVDLVDDKSDAGFETSITDYW